jgi:hypothetical protein
MTMKQIPLNFLLLLPLLLSCGPAEGPGGGESPVDFAVRLAEEHDGPEVARRLREEMSLQGEAFLVDEESLVRRGYGLRMEGRLETSFRVLFAAADLFPDSWRVLDNLAEAAIYRGDRDLAQASFERALALDSLNSEARWKLPDLDRRIMEAGRETPTPARHQPGENTGLLGPYLGQEPPGVTPEVFAPGVVSTRGGHEFSCTFSADGEEFYFNRGPDVFVAYQRGEGWTAPVPAHFNTPELDHEPFISGDNRYLYLGSGRPRDDSPPWGPYGIWRFERTEEGWGNESFLFPGMYVTLTEAGDAYLTDIFGVAGGGIGVHRMTEGSYQPLERLQGGANLMNAAHPLIAPDGSHMIFDADGGLFITLRRGDGGWTEPRRLEELDTGGELMTASFSHDGRYLFYYSFHDIYWVSAEVLDPYLGEESAGFEG